MIISPKFVSLLTLISLTLLPLRAVASPSPSGLGPLLSQYSHARAQGNNLQQMLYASRIKKQIFAAEADHQSGSAQYLKLLGEIDRFADREPQAAYELAKSLQLHWEARYAARVQGTDALRRRAGGEIGAMAGMLGLGLAVMKPHLLPRYFRLVRHLMPVAGTLGGAGAVSALQNFGAWNSDVPPSPAHVMKLNLPETDLELDDEALVEELVSLSASIGVSSLVLTEASAIRGILKALRVAKLANQSATAFKAHPVVLIGSLIAGVLVEEGAHAAIRGHLSKELKQEVLSTAKACRQAIRENNDRAILESADALAMAVARLSRFQDRKFDEANEEYLQDLAEIAEVVSDFGEDRLPKDYVESMQKIANEDFQKELRDIQEDQPLTLASRHYLVREAISSQGPEAVPAMMQEDREVTREELKRFMDWVSAREHQTLKAIVGPERIRLMLSYFAKENARSRTYWANNLAMGDINDDPILNLLWAQSLLESSKREFVSDALDIIAGELNRAKLVRRGGVQ